MMKILLIHNPVSGKSGNEHILAQLRKLAVERQVQLEVYSTCGSDDELKIRERLQSIEVDLLLAFGGDGTVNTAAQIARDKDLVLGIIPGGTSNGLARDLGIPADPLEAFLLCLEGRNIIPMDMIQVNEQMRLVHLGDVGANTELLRRMENSADGKFHDAVNFIRQFVEGTQFDYEIETDSETVQGKASMIAFCNARRYGTGIPLTKAASPSDGKFELVIFEEIRFSTLLTSALATLQDSFFTEQDRQILTATSATIKLREPRRWQADGELYPAEKEIRLQILPGQLKVICGRDCPYPADAGNDRSVRFIPPW